MEFQSGQNCVTEIKDMLCAKYIKILCYIENIETSCAKYTNVMQNAETLCSKCENVMLKMHKTHAQSPETLCSKCTKLVHKTHAQNVEVLCTKLMLNAQKCGNVMLDRTHKTKFKMRNRIADASSWLCDPDSN